ncbi:acyl-CoA synthetases /AMP-acid ligases II [Aspergillus pseudoustus]|uniref:Acyl-CoA synthetases /AMP-acid ligases II n=1 Tax=Aspergillus pseudoustus TaxID=1810923 RepID=A0ABR4K233_9EURO
MAVTQPTAAHLHTLSPTQFLPRAAEIEPDAPAINHVALNGHLVQRTYREFAHRAAALGYYLRNRQFKRVGILATNTPAFLEAIFGIASAGAVNVAINYRLKANDIKYIFEHSRVDVVIADVQYVSLLDSFRDAHPDIPVLVDTDAGQNDDGPFSRAIREGMDIDHREGDCGWAGLEAQSSDEDGMIALAYTSGTTSRPKGVVYTHRGAYLAAMSNIVESQLNVNTGSDRCGYLWTLPMFHAMGWTFPWAITAVRGTHYCLRKIDYPRLWHLLRNEQITHFCAAPTVNTLLCHAKEAAPLSRKVRVTVAASPPSAVLFEKMTSLNLHPVHAYGLTETYGPVTMAYYHRHPSDGDDRYQKLARQGHAVLTSLPIRVTKAESGSGSGDALTDVAKDGTEIGEIIVQGNLCAKEYYNDHSATEKLFAGGWLHTGDLAVWHPDGAIQILDRAKDIIISGGENISSVAVESVLLKHTAVLEAAVIGIPDEQWGETPKAFITRVSGNGTTGPEILHWARENSEMGRFMVPREVEIVEELPKTSTGKVQKKLLREREMSRRKRPASL